jgi:hypothetical protein
MSSVAKASKARHTRILKLLVDTVTTYTHTYFYQSLSLRLPFCQYVQTIYIYVYIHMYAEYIGRNLHNKVLAAGGFNDLIELDDVRVV